jgi:hypothetical protein
MDLMFELQLSDSGHAGHVFSVTYDQGASTATWTNLDGSGSTAFADFPATAIARDSNGDLYVGSTGLPHVEVAGLTIVASARKLYAATHVEAPGN